MKLELIKPNDEVIYIPFHLRKKGEEENMVQDQNLGVVTSKNDTYVFVRFKGYEAGIACRPEDLFTLRNRPDLSARLNNAYEQFMRDNLDRLSGKK